MKIYLPISKFSTVNEMVNGMISEPWGTLISLQRVGLTPADTTRLIEAARCSAAKVSVELVVDHDMAADAAPRLEEEVK